MTLPNSNKLVMKSRLIVDLLSATSNTGHDSTMHRTGAHVFTNYLYKSIGNRSKR